MILGIVEIDRFKYMLVYVVNMNQLDSIVRMYSSGDYRERVGIEDAYRNLLSAVEKVSKAHEKDGLNLMAEIVGALEIRFDSPLHEYLDECEEDE